MGYVVLDFLTFFKIFFLIFPPLHENDFCVCTRPTPRSDQEKIKVSGCRERPFSRQLYHSPGFQHHVLINITDKSVPALGPPLTQVEITPLMY